MDMPVNLEEIVRASYRRLQTSEIVHWTRQISFDRIWGT